MIAAAHRQRHHGERGVLVAGGGKSISAEDIQIRNIVRLAKRIEHAVLWGGAHARGSDFVDRAAQRALTGRRSLGCARRIRGSVGRARSSGKASRSAASETGHGFAARLAKKLFGLLVKIGDDLPVVV